MRGVDLEPAGKHGQSRPQELLIGREKLVAPVDRPLHRLLARQIASVTRPETQHAFAKASGESADSKRVETHRGQLESQGQPVEPATDLKDGRRAVRVEGEATASRGGAFDEERDGIGSPCLGR